MDAKQHTEDHLAWVQRMMELKLEATRENLISEEEGMKIIKACDEFVKQASDFEAFVLSSPSAAHPCSRKSVAGNYVLDIAEIILNQENSA